MFSASIESGKQRHIQVNVDGNKVRIPVDETVYAYFNEQFLREHPTTQQEKKFATIMNVMRAAYLKGIEDGRKTQEKAKLKV